MPKKQIIFSACILLAAAAALLWLLRPAPEPVTGGPIGHGDAHRKLRKPARRQPCGPTAAGRCPRRRPADPPAAVEVLEGDTAFSLLERVCAERGLALEAQRGIGSVYVQGIGGVREFDCGPLSGWLFRINGEIRSTDSGSVVLQDGDILEFLYTCELGEDVD